MAEAITVRQLLESKPQSQVYSIRPDATVFEALKVMADARVGALPVMDGEKLLGMFSERDYARKIILEGRASKDTLVREVMTSPACTVSPDQTIKECMVLMNKNRFRHLPVVEGERVIGMVSIGDVVRAVLMALL